MCTNFVYNSIIIHNILIYLRKGVSVNHNILKETEVTSIFFIYTDNGMKRKYSVKLRFMDQKECYFAMFMPDKFVKPKKKTPVDIIVYTPDGVYTTQVTLVDTTLSMSDILFNVTIPKTWKFKQLRQSTRKQQALPFNIKFDDGFEINGETFDISLGGISYLADKTFSGIYERLKCTLTVEMPNDLIINFPDKKLITEAYFVRKKENFGEYGSGGTLYAFKFTKLSNEELEILRHYLLSLM